MACNILLTSRIRKYFRDQNLNFLYHKLGYLFVAILFLSFGCASQKQFKKAQSDHTIAAYENYLAAYPDNKCSEEARQELALLYEDKDWDKYSQANTIIAFQSYIEKYPDGRYMQQAKKQIYELKEQQAWQSAHNDNTIQAYESFLSSFPSSYLTGEANIRIAQLKDEQDWNEAKETGTIMAFESYLSAYPQGQHVDQANTRLEELAIIQSEFQSASDSNTVASYTQFLQKYPDSPYTLQAQEQLNLLENREYNKAIQANTIEAYDYFLSIFPDGEYAEDVDKRLVDLEVDAIFSGKYGRMPAMNRVSGGDEYSSNNQIKVYNNTSYNLTVFYSGPESKRISLAPKETSRITLVNGKYRVAASVDASNIGNYGGTENLEGGYYDIEYYIVTRYY